VIPEPRFDRIDYSNPRAYVALGGSIGNAKRIGTIAVQLKRHAPVATFRAIEEWMSRNLRYDPNAAYNWRNFDQIIDDGTLGGCADHSIVFGALSRACDIPTVWVKTMDYDWIRDFKKHGPVGSWRGHVFLEVYIQDGWALLDAQGMMLYEDYDRTSRFFPGGRYAYDKGADPYELILSVRWGIWKKQTADYFAKFDLSGLSGSGDERLRGTSISWRVTPRREGVVEEDVSPTIQLRQVKPDYDSWLKNYFEVTVANNGNEDIVILKPLDGSQWSWHLPFYRFTVIDEQGRVSAMGARCGISGLWANTKWPADYIVTLKPGESFKKTLEVLFAIPEDGEYQVKFEYVMELEKDPHKGTFLEYPVEVWKGTAESEVKTYFLKKQEL
jgi:hypothetical protein